VESAAAEIISSLRRMGDPVRARSAQHYFKHEIVALGLTAPVLRAFVRERVGGLRRTWQAAQAIQLCDRLLCEPEMEIRGAGFLILGAFRKQLKPDLLKAAERWFRQRLDNWALVDGFCSTVLSPLMEQHPEVEDTLAAWSRAKSLWLRRAALVTLVPFARRGLRLGTAYRLASEHFADSEDLMHKATGWLLREAGKTDRPQLKRYLLRHGAKIPRTALRYAIERFPAAERTALLQTTRPTSKMTKRA
jgi:3-methyladenine DNA glycosylase AlkD